MSDSIKHECAVSLVRLRKPLSWFQQKYGTADYGVAKMSLLLGKQHNRGQDGAGIASLHLDVVPGEPAYKLIKSADASPLAVLLSRLGTIKNFSGEVTLGHLRYGTYGRNDISFCHPFVHDSSLLVRTLLVAGNFNLTDTNELFREFLALGHHPVSRSDGYILLEAIAHQLSNTPKDAQGLTDWPRILRGALNNVDGAFTLCGMNGEGDAFAIRDSHGIRPGFYYCDDEVFVAASERPALQAAFNCPAEEVKELPPGKAVVIRRSGEVEFHDCLTPAPRRSCVFERIYFSRPNDADIHQERKALGRALVPAILKATNQDFDHTFFSYIPNSAQVSFHGMLETLFKTALPMGKCARFGQIAIKDAKFRTFIADAAARRELYMHVYDVTYGLITPGEDSLVVLDDSIVRGNTMLNAILPILDRLGPKQIVVASSAPPIKYPDCYGIDMATAGELIAFQAAVEILKRTGREALIGQAAERARKDLAGETPAQNRMKELYDAIPDEELVDEIGRLLTPPGLKAKLTVVFQTCPDLRQCCPNHTGDWYFTGDYPTPGGIRMVNQALVNYTENNNDRAY